MNTGEKNMLDVDRLRKLEALFKTLYPALNHFAFKYLKDEDIAKDIVQNAFVMLWENFETIQDENAIKGYLYKTIYTRSLNYLRDHKKIVNIDNDAEFERISDYSDSNESSLKEERLLKIKCAIDKLPEKCREIFILNKYQGLKYKEIAEEKGISIKTVEAQMGKALKMLREELKDINSVVLMFVLLENIFRQT